MDIEKLQRKRQLNVQEQNAITEHKIFSEASYWRINGLSKALTKVFEDKGIFNENYIIVRYDQNFPGCSTDEGIIVTEDERFIKFELDLSESRDRLIELYLWDDITSTVEIEKSKRGKGASWGYLALKVLNTLNGKLTNDR